MRAIVYTNVAVFVVVLPSGNLNLNCLAEAAEISTAAPSSVTVIVIVSP